MQASTSSVHKVWYLQIIIIIIINISEVSKFMGNQRHMSEKVKVKKYFFWFNAKYIVLYIIELLI